MSLTSSPASQVTAVQTPGLGARARRGGAAMLIVLSLLFVSAACGMNVQTSQPYTPADGVNADVPPSGADPDAVVHIRNLLIISHAKGEGLLAGSLVCSNRDSLTGVSGTATKVDGSTGAPFTGTITDPVSVANGVLVVLTDRALITVTSADLEAGLDASVTLKFANAGEITLRVPVVDGNIPQYQSITPAPTTPSPTPSS